MQGYDGSPAGNGRAPRSRFVLGRVSVRNSEPGTATYGTWAAIHVSNDHSTVSGRRGDAAWPDGAAVVGA